MGDDLISPKFVEIFDTYFPYYLSLGMSYNEFWNERPELCKAYRKAHEIKLNRTNEELWMQGGYIRDAVASVVGSMFSKTEIKYPSEPYPITKEKAEAKREEEAKKKFERMKAFMESRAKKEVK